MIQISDRQLIRIEDITEVRFDTQTPEESLCGECKSFVEFMTAERQRPRCGHFSRFFDSWEEMQAWFDKEIRPVLTQCGVEQR